MTRPQYCGFVSLLYSIGDKPLNLWSKHVSLDGRIRRVADQTLRGDKVIEIMGPHRTPVPTNITCPASPMDILNITLPILVLVIKNLELMFKVEFQLMDKKRHRRQFCLTTYNPDKSPLPHTNTAHVPLKLDDGWNNLEIDLQTLCKEIYGFDYQAIQRIIIYPNCRLRRVYFQDRHYEQEETPVELCQAFFDMYMLKWGIHLVERSCQTEEIYTGPLQPCDLEYFATPSNMSVSFKATSSPSYKDSRIGQIKQIMEKNICMSMNFGHCKSITLKNNSQSANQMGKKGEVIVGNDGFQVSTNSTSSNHDVKIVKVMDKRKIKSAISCKRDRVKLEHRAKKHNKQNLTKEKVTSHESVAQPLMFQERNESLKSFSHLSKSQYLREHVGENSVCSKPKVIALNLQQQPQQHIDIVKQNDIQHRVSCKMGETLNPQGECDSINFDQRLGPSDNKRITTSKIECIKNSKAPVDISMNKSKLEIKDSNNIREKLAPYKGDGLLSHSVRAIEEVINEVRKIKDQLTNYDIQKTSRIPSLANSKDSLKEAVSDVPPIVEIQATLSEEKPKNTVLSTDKAVSDFLELRHKINKKILEKLQDKGLTITEVELSIYNSKNRRNCYGQGKLIESWKGSVNKGSGLSSIEPVEIDVSLKKPQLTLNDKICMQLRNELDAALLHLKSTHVRLTAKVVEDTIGNIVKEDSRRSSTDYFTVKEAQHIKRTVCNESILQCDTNTKPCTKYLKNGNNQMDDFIKNLHKYSETEIVNVLFERKMYDSEVKYGST